MENLRQAREQDKLDQFAKDHDADAPGDWTHSKCSGCLC